MSELGPDARALLDGTRDGDDPSDRDRARMRQRLQIAIAAAATGAAASAAAPAMATAATSSTGAVATAGATAAKAGVGVQLATGVQAVTAASVTAKIGVAVTVAVIGAAGSGAVLKSEIMASKSAREPAAAVAQAPRARPREPATGARLSAPPAVLAVAEAPAVIEAPAVVPVPAVASVERAAPKPAVALKAKAAAPAVEAPSIPPSLETEIRLLSLAQSALRERQHDRALSLLAEHAVRFPNGTLALERDAVRAIVLCNSGRSGAGRAAAETLAPRIAGSPLAARLERACARDPYDHEDEP